MGRMRLAASAITLLLFLSAAGCFPSSGPKPPDGSAPASTERESVRKIIPYQADEQTFQMTGGWLNSETLAIAEYDGTHTVLSSYSIYSGEKKELGRVEMPVTHFETSGDGNHLLLQGSSSPQHITLLLMDQDGSVQFDKEFTAHDLSFSWNRQNPDRLFVTAFKEDWSYSTSILYPLSGGAAENAVDAPFAKWSGKNTLLYTEEIQQPAGSLLYEYNIIEKKSELADEQVIAFFTGEDARISLKFSEEGESYAVNAHGDERTYPATLLNQEGNLEVPNGASAGEMFLTYEFSDAFSLVSYSLADGQKRTVLKDAVNAPLRISPDGKSVLYGYQLENVIDLQTGSLTRLIIY